MIVADSMRDFAIAKISDLLEDFVAALNAAGKAPDVETVHKVRVSIRRLQQGLRLFRPYLSKSGADKLKVELRAIMDVAGELRNRDIAIELVKETEGSEALIEDLSMQRAKFDQEFADVLRHHAKPDLAPRWRSKLGLHTP
ncbi:MAG TPA: CHAD domain-containing protein [Bryobacteraceae bacterium]|nr:CHAD domain-containing protein [Bryobacteraceae bacterium]